MAKSNRQTNENQLAAGASTVPTPPAEQSVVSPPDAPVTNTPPEQPSVQPAIAAAAERGVMIEVIVGEASNGYEQRNLSRPLSFAHAAVARRIINGMRAAGVTRNGNAVESLDDLIGLWLDRVATAIAAGAA